MLYLCLYRPFAVDIVEELRFYEAIINIQAKAESMYFNQVFFLLVTQKGQFIHNMVSR
jgi:hypothetical protein